MRNWTYYLEKMKPGFMVGISIESRGEVYRRPKGLTQTILLLTHSGTGLFRVGGERVVTKRDDLVMILPGTPHEYETGPTGTWRSVWVHFDAPGVWQSWFNWTPAAPGLLRLCLAGHEFRTRVVRRLIDIWRIASVGRPYRLDFCVNALAEVLLWCRSANPFEQRRPLDPKLQRTVDFLCLHPERDVSVPELAEVACLSPSRLSHVFREQLGMSIVQFREKQRMERAVLLLRGTQMPISEIAFRCGFADPLYFATRFKRAMGQSPRRFRATGGSRRGGSPFSGRGKPKKSR